MENFPFVSVIIPAKNEERFIKLCLNSLIQQSYPSDRYELIVVDNCSSDNTEKLALGMGVKVLKCHANTIGGVRNFGAKSSNGDVLAFIDADCVAKRDWIMTSVNELSTGEATAIGGDALKRPESRWVERWWILPANHHDNFSFTLNGCSMFFYRKAYDEIHGFSASVNANEDTIFSGEIKRKGGVVKWIEGADVIHYGYPQTVLQFFMRQFWLASSYIRTGSGVYDKTFIFTILHLIGILIILVAFISLNKIVFYSGFFLFIIGPVLFSLKKIMNSDFRLCNIYWLPIFFLSIVYFSARSFGLVYSFSGKSLNRVKA